MADRQRSTQDESLEQARRQPLIRVWVIAPALAVRAGLRALLSADQQIEVIGEAAVLLGFDSLPSNTDVFVIAAATDPAPDLQTALTVASSAGVLLLIEDTLPAGWDFSRQPGRAWGLLPLDSSVEELTAAIHAIAEGLIVGTPALIEALLVSHPPAQREDAEPLIEPLTDREIEVLQLLAQGLANKQIAVTLGISEHTVKFHVSGIYTRLGAASRTEAVRLGVRQGLIVL